MRLLTLKAKYEHIAGETLAILRALISDAIDVLVVGRFLSADRPSESDIAADARWSALQLYGRSFTSRCAFSRRNWYATQSAQ